MHAIMFRVNLLWGEAKFSYVVPSRHQTQLENFLNKIIWELL